MKKILLTASTLAMFCLSPLAGASTISDITDKFFQSETYSVGISKDTTEALKAKYKEVTTDASFSKVEVSLGNSEESDESDPDGDSDTDDNPVAAKFYLSADKNTMYFFIDEGTPGYPNYGKVQLNDLEGSKNTGISVYTNVSDAALSFKGSNDNELHFTVAPAGLILEILGMSSDEASNIKTKKFKSFLKSFAMIK